MTPNHRNLVNHTFHGGRFEDGGVDVDNLPDVLRYKALLVDVAKREGAAVLLRGVRTFQDWEYELRMMQMNRHLAPAIETLFLAPAVEHAFLSSSLVREVAGLGGDVADLVPPSVAAAIAARAGSKGR